MQELGYPFHHSLVNQLRSQTVSQIVDRIKQLPKKSTIYLYSPVVRGRKGEYKKEISSTKKEDLEKYKLIIKFTISIKFQI